MAIGQDLSLERLPYHTYWEEDISQARVREPSEDPQRLDLKMTELLVFVLLSLR